MHEPEPVSNPLLSTSPRGDDRWKASSKLLTVDAFHLRLEDEMRRHARYLTGAAMIRIAMEGGGTAHASLAEAIATESRCTDAATALHDGSFCVLLVHADEVCAHRLATRLVEVACELADADEASMRCVIGIASTRGRRLSAEELWDESEREFWPKRSRPLRLSRPDER